jgi:Lrp/AsnC family transcriptional regulator, leucine-responsive regulatory protein
MFEIDRIDHRILDVLQRQGRVSMTELGEQVGLSTSPCSERVKRLERQGYINGYHAHVDPVRLGRFLLVFIEITLSQKSPQIFEVVKREVGQMPELQECHLVSGSFDYLLKARLRVMTEYRELLGKILDKIPVPAQSNSYVVMEEIKESTVIPLDR